MAVLDSLTSDNGQRPHRSGSHGGPHKLSKPSSSKSSARLSSSSASRFPPTSSPAVKHSEKATAAVPPVHAKVKALQQAAHPCEATSPCGDEALKAPDTDTKDEASSVKPNFEEGEASDQSGSTVNTLTDAEIEKDCVPVEKTDQEDAVTANFQPVLVLAESPQISSVNVWSTQSEESCLREDIKVLDGSNKPILNSSSTCCKTEEDLIEANLEGMDLMLTEHLNSEQEGFLFPKSEPELKIEPALNGDDGAAPAEASLEFRGKNEPSQSPEIEAALNSSSDIRGAALNVHDSVHKSNIIATKAYPILSSDCDRAMGAAFTALARDLLESNLSSPNPQEPRTACTIHIPRKVLIAALLSFIAVFSCLLSSIDSHSQRRFLPPT